MLIAKLIGIIYKHFDEEYTRIEKVNFFKIRVTNKCDDFYFWTDEDNIFYLMDSDYVYKGGSFLEVYAKYSINKTNIMCAQKGIEQALEEEGL